MIKKFSSRETTNHISACLIIISFNVQRSVTDDDTYPDEIIFSIFSRLNFIFSISCLISFCSDLTFILKFFWDSIKIYNFTSRRISTRLEEFSGTLALALTFLWLGLINEFFFFFGSFLKFLC